MLRTDHTRPINSSRRTATSGGSRRSRGGNRRSRSAAKGERIYAIGDIHGRYDLLRDLMRRIEAHSKGLPNPETLHVVLLGDVVDRGPDSAKILNYLHEWTKHATGQVMLLGNHEEMMLRAHAGDARVIRAWLKVGGRETLASFGLSVSEEEEIVTPPLVAAVREALPDDLMKFVSTWPLTARSGDYYFCHAGVKPNVALEKQVKKDLIWIRDEFLGSAVDHGAVVVHGHSITPSIDLQSNRVGIDTGAYFTGVLTAIYVEGQEMDFISTGKQGPR